ncbi:MAG TPA: hypothetical protein VFK05_20130 [Polyangiaceae bacterium]|nr:hypothetical protein [Polyangiaceae bacterium]
MFYSFGDVKRKEVKGQQVGDAWTFAIPEKIPTDAFVSLEFNVFVPVADQADAQAKLLPFARSVHDAVHESFDVAVSKTSSLTAGRWEVLLPIFTAEARKRVSALARQANLGAYYAEGVPAVEAILRKSHFQKVMSGDPNEPANVDWEPTPQALDDLKKFGTPAAQELRSAHDKIKNYRESSDSAECLGPKTAFDGGGNAPQREAALKACFKQLLDSAQAAGLPRDNAAVSDDLKKARQKSLNDLSAVDQNKIVESLVNFPPGADSLLIKLQPQIDTVLRAIKDASADDEQAAKKAPANRVAREAAIKTSTALKSYIDAQGALDFVAALEIEQKQTIDAWELQVSGEFVPAPDKLVIQLTFARQATASQLLKVKPGKPRFFISTGIAVTSLNNEPWGDPNKLSIPVLVSICWSRAGCESKGFGSGGHPLDYVSTDLGVNTVFLGQKNPRQGTPSFLFGLGLTPIYATHVSVGMNLFENPQTSQANVAAYVALTINVVDGAGILGALGMGKPTPEVISGAPPSPP